MATRDRVDPDLAREGQNHAGLGLAPVPRIVTGDEVHVGVETERRELPPSARFTVVGRETELQTAICELPQHCGQARRAAQETAAFRP